jgi:cytochrome c-type biogenesis protein
VTTFTLPALFLAGLLTFLSPCVLPLVPIYLAMLAGTSATALREGGHGRRLVASTAAFALGLAAVFVLLGLAASSIGRLLSGHRALVSQLAGLAVFLAGLKLMGFLHVPGLDREARPWLASVRRGGGLLWPFLFGAAFALGWSPCIGPVLGSVLLFAAGAGSKGLAAGYLAVYALGLTLPLLVVSLAAAPALRLLDRAKRHLRAFELASGTLLAAVGLLFITGHESLLTGSPAPATLASAATAAPSPAESVTCGVHPGAPAEETAPLTSAPAERLPTMLEFVATGCPVCEKMAPVVAEVEGGCSRHGVRVERIDVATASGRAAASANGVLGVPTFLFLDRDGREVARLVGQQPRNLLIQSLEVLAGEKCDGFRPLPASPGPGT